MSQEVVSLGSIARVAREARAKWRRSERAASWSAIDGSPDGVGLRHQPDDMKNLHTLLENLTRICCAR